MTSFELIDCLRERFPDYRFFECIDVDQNLAKIYIRRFDEFKDTGKFIFERNKYLDNPIECFEQIVDWLDNYISTKRPAQTVCCENRLELRAMKPMTCEKCGAPLKSCTCEYCGTRYYIPNVETTTFWADNKQVMQVEKELNQAKFDVTNQAELNDIQNMVNQLRTLGGNGSLEYMLSSGAINAATARDMYMTKMASCFINYGGQT